MAVLMRVIIFDVQQLKFQAFSTLQVLHNLLPTHFTSILFFRVSKESLNFCG